MVESTALEMRRTRECTVGSNPTLSAKPPHRHVHDRPENRAKSHLNEVVFPIKASPIVRLPPLPFAPIIRGRIRGLGKWVAKLKA